jgi:hypothetical protein
MKFEPRLVSRTQALEVLRLVDVDDLFGLHEIGPLPMLWHLEIHNARQLVDVTHDGGLPALTHLDLSECSSVRDLSPIGKLQKLEKLAIVGLANIVDLGVFARHPGLTQLCVHAQVIDGVEILDELPQLRTLELGSCTTTLELVAGNLDKLEELRLAYCVGRIVCPPLGRAERPLEFVSITSCRDVVDLAAVGYVRSLQVVEPSSEVLTSLSEMHIDVLRLEADALTVLPRLPRGLRRLELVCPALKDTANVPADVMISEESRAKAQ